MKPIPKDLIEKADYLINHLSHKQIVELLRTYLSEQLFLSDLIIRSHLSMKDDELAHKCNILFLVIYKCYQNYRVKMPTIKGEFVKSNMDQYDEILEMSQEQEQTYFEFLTGMKNLIKQDDLMDYVILKLVGTIENPVIYKSDIDKNIAVNEILTVILCCNNEMKKHIRIDAN